MRADLDLDRLALGPDDRRVQRLVHVELRHRDVVLEPAGHRVPPRVQRAERRVAVAHRLDEHAHRDEVVDLLEVAAAHDHLLVDGVVVLRPAGHRGLDLGAAQVVGHLRAHPGEVLLTGRCALGDEPHDLVVDLGVEGGEGQVLQLPLDGVHAEPVGQRRVDLERLVGLALGRLARDVAPGAGVVQPVGELDDEDADVAGHRDDHLAHGLGLGRLAVGDLVELGHPVDEPRDLVAEVAAQLRQLVVGVLDRVVQQRRRERGRRHPELGEDRRHGEGMRDVGVAGEAHLPAVVLLGHEVGALDDGQVGLGVRRAHGLEDRLEDGVGGPGTSEAGEARAHPGRRRQGRRRRSRVRADLLAHDRSLDGGPYAPRRAVGVRARRWRAGRSRRPARGPAGTSAPGRRRCR